MKPANGMEETIKRNLNFTASAEMRERILTDVMDAQEEAQKTKSALAGPNMRSIIMKSPITKLVAAAVIIVVTMICIRWFGVAVPAYGITEALALCENADIVHIKGWKYLHTGDDTQLEKFPFELWFDKKNGRFRDLHSLRWYGDYTTDEPTYSLTVSDGLYTMKTKYCGNRGTTEFTKLSPFQQRLQIHTLEVFPGFMANPENVEGFARVGQERIKSGVADIWEGEVVAPDETVPYKKLRIVLLPSTGEIVRLFLWINAEEDSVRWVPLKEAHTIEYNIIPPVDCFKTESPEGYELVNTKETAIERELGPTDADRIRFYGCIGFTLNDGSVIFGWHANHKPEESQAHLFANLKSGGPLPNLPAQIVGLKSWPVEEDITFVGRHLAHTQKNSKFYEWGLYVPNRKMPERDTFQDYKVIAKYNGIEPRSFLGRPNLVGQELDIKSEEEFDTWVLGAMAELSDDSKAPEYVTYESVLQLTKQIRESLAQ